MLPFVRSFCAFAALTFDQNPTPRPVVTPAPTTTASPAKPTPAKPTPAKPTPAKRTRAELDAVVDALEEAFIASTEPGWVAAERAAKRYTRKRVLTRADAEFEAQVAVAPEPAPVITVPCWSFSGGKRIRDRQDLTVTDTVEARHLAAGDTILVGGVKGGVHEEKVVDVQVASAKTVLVLTDKGAFEALATAAIHFRGNAEAVDVEVIGVAHQTRYGSWETRRTERLPWAPSARMIDRAAESTPRSMADVARGDELARLIAAQAADDKTSSRRRTFTRLSADPMEGYEGLVLACEDFLGEFTAIGHVRPVEEPETPKVVGPVRWLGSKQRNLSA